ncbi:hypothetical protein AGLY_007446 [Aphis glycines]|uniref:Uncharacterized protein n=1 Tax=Aphis glycines TaxID=307491 RepID=A0A6G0TM10_APHGL|nr:hypothetical protein AGLY_007446 [Aphis glycines]
MKKVRIGFNTVITTLGLLEFQSPDVASVSKPCLQVMHNSGIFKGMHMMKINKFNINYETIIQEIIEYNTQTHYAAGQFVAGGLNNWISITYIVVSPTFNETLTLNDSRDPVVKNHLDFNRYSDMFRPQNRLNQNKKLVKKIPSSYGLPEILSAILKATITPKISDQECGINY